MNRQKLVIAVFISIVIIFLSYNIYARLQLVFFANTRVVEAKAQYEATFWEYKTQNIPRDDTAKFWGTWGSVAAIVGGTVIALVAGGFGIGAKYFFQGYAEKQKADYVPIKIANVHGMNEFTIHRRTSEEIGGLVQLALQNQTVESVHAGEHRSFEKGYKIATFAQQVGKTLHVPTKQAHQPIALPSANEHIPTFAELYQQGKLSFGNSMILGFLENGTPYTGSFLNIYSSAIAGESGSGKSWTLCYLITSALLTCHAEFWTLDPHYPHPLSLGKRLEPLWKTGHIHFEHMYDQMKKVLLHIETTIDRRLQQLDTNTTPLVLVIDELAFLSKTSIGSAVAHTMERIAQEGRKCDIYLLASSQTWLTDRTGGNSALRDCLTSAYVHRIKPKQANLLLQDTDLVHIVKKQIKDAGQVLFCPVNDDEQICRIPQMTPQDIQMVATYLTPQKEEERKEEENKKLSDGHIPTEDECVEILHARFQAVSNTTTKTAWQEQTAPKIGISTALLTSIMSGARTISEETYPKILQFLGYEFSGLTA